MGILLSVGCGSGGRQDPAVAEFSHDRLHPRDAVSTVTAVDPVFGRLYGMAVNGRTLWLADESGDPFLYRFNLPDFVMDRAIGQSGEGPGDFKSATDLSVRPGDGSAIWVFDARTKRFSRVADDRTAERRSLGPLPSSIIHAVWLAANRGVGLTRSDTSRFVLFDSMGTAVGHIPGPLLGADSVPMRPRMSLSSAVKLCPRPSSDQFAVMYLGAGRLEIVDPASGQVKSAAVPFASEGEFAVNPHTGAWAARAPRNFYVNCTADADHLYVLFSGRRLDGFDPDAASSGRFIHIFDWSGTLQGVLRLDRDATSLALSGGGNLIVSSLGSDSVAVVSVADLGE
jgi:hypothetical protein